MDRYDANPLYSRATAAARVAELESSLGRLRAESEQLRARVREQARQLSYNDAHNHKRNLQLDALHFVWCDGGCSAGVHRYAHGELTEAIVAEAERNTQRLRRWLTNKTARDARRPAPP